jgi:type I restriction enzyme S subunit
MQNLGKAKAAQPGLNREDLQNIILLIPNETVLKKFHEIIEPLFKQLFSNSKEIGELLKVRGELLPLLVNGQITIKKEKNSRTL